MAPKRVAIIGGGCSGIAALWALRYSEHEVHLYEAEPKLPNFIDTFPFLVGDRIVRVNTQLVTFKASTSPNLCTFLRDLHVPFTKADLSIASSQHDGSFEWSYGPLWGYFGQLRNLLRPDAWKMIAEVTRFNVFSLDVLRPYPKQPIRDWLRKGQPRMHWHSYRGSIGDYLKGNKYSSLFQDRYIIPLVSILWNIQDPVDVLDLPAAEVIRFLFDHDLLCNFFRWRDWSTVQAGSVDFEGIISHTIPPGRIHLNCSIQSVHHENVKSAPFHLKTADNEQTQSFDHIIFATPATVSAELLHNIIHPDETRLLSRFEANRIVAALHSDSSLMPKRKHSWALSNYISVPNTGKLSVTHCMSLLQGQCPIHPPPIFISLNTILPPNPLSIRAIWAYQQPTVTARVLAARPHLPSIQNSRGLSYCGAWTGYGRHEDAVRSAWLIAVDHLGAHPPFAVVDSLASQRPVPRLGVRQKVLRLFVLALLFVLGFFRICLGLFGSSREKQKRKTNYTRSRRKRPMYV